MSNPALYVYCKLHLLFMATIRSPTEVQFSETWKISVESETFFFNRGRPNLHEKSLKKFRRNYSTSIKWIKPKSYCDENKIYFIGENGTYLSLTLVFDQAQVEIRISYTDFLGRRVGLIHMEENNFPASIPPIVWPWVERSWWLTDYYYFKHFTRPVMWLKPNFYCIQNQF